MSTVPGLLTAIRILHLVAAILALMLVLQGRHEHRPFAVFVFVTAMARRAAMGLARFLVPAVAAADGEPLHGMARVVGHLHHGLLLMWPASVVTLAVVTFASPKRPLLNWYYVAVAAALWLLFVVTYPSTRELHAAGYALAQVTAVLAAAVAIGRWHFVDEEPKLHHACVLMVVLAEACLLAGPYRTGIFGSGWDGARGVYLGLYAALVVAQGGALWLRYKD